MPLNSNNNSDKPGGDEHCALLDCSGYVYAREQCQHLFQNHIITICRCLSERLAESLTWNRACCTNSAQSDGSVQDPKITINQSINRNMCRLTTAQMPSALRCQTYRNQPSLQNIGTSLGHCHAGWACMAMHAHRMASEGWAGRRYLREN